MTSALFQGTKHAQLYSKFRPYPPQKLIEHIITYLKDKTKLKPPFNKAIDIGCGSGQSTVVLSPYFKNVLGVDVSDAQLKCAKEIHALPNIEYKISSGEELPVPPASVELVTLCQTIHWFNPPNDLYKEICRVLVPNGVITAYGYLNPLPKTKDETKNGEIKELIMQYLHEDKLGVYWDKERYMVLNQYADINLPFQDCQRSSFVKESESSLADYIGYLSTWSSYQKLMKNNPENAKELLKEVENRLRSILESTESSETICLKLQTDYFMMIGHL